MNRQRYVDRDFQNEGSPRSQELAAALAVQCDPELLEAFLHLKGALDEFGGQAFIAATRERISVEEDGTIRKDERGVFTTLGYIVHYGSKASLKRLQTEEDAGQVEAAPEPDAEQPYDGEGEIEEPVAVGAGEES